MTRRKGFTLVELMVVVAIVAILAAVALPMFSIFKQKARVNTAIKSCAGAVAVLQEWYSENHNFTDLSVPTNGGSIVFDATTKIGAGLPEIESMEWSLSSPATSIVRINWVFTGACTSICNGYYQLECWVDNDKCEITVRLDDADTLGLNIP